MKPRREAVAFVLYRDGSREEFLSVLRPENDPDLPGVWGLPAGSKEAGESWEGALLRAGREKLGVDLRVRREIFQGEAEREGYRLHLRLYEVEVLSGEIRLREGGGKTYYPEWKWVRKEDLEEAASRGSLCCRGFLREVEEG
jgi:ADP-ribose pyrophosphatase YjhB (NUDIX family)